MDWKVAAVAFGTVLLAELGDKTQVGVLGLASSTSSRLSVFLGASAALVVSTALAVVGAELVGRLVPAHWLQRGAGALLIVLGIVFLARS